VCSKLKKGETMQREYPTTHGNTPLMTALVGGVIGAATALFFSDDKRRKQVGEKVGEIMGDIKQQTKGVRDDFEEKTEEIIDKVKHNGHRDRDQEDDDGVGRKR
jgi:hypothetical protein